MNLTAYGITDIGLVRKNNEDQLMLSDLQKSGNTAIGVEKGFLFDGNKALLAVSDGMGGALAGEVASRMAMEILLEELSCFVNSGSPETQLVKAIEKAHSEISTRSQNDPGCSGMGATLTAALIVDSIAYLAQVGDSRGYLLKNSAIQQLTKDQSMLQMMLDMGTITPEEADHAPYRNVILQALGAVEKIEVVITRHELQPGEMLLLCSDGLSNKVDNQTILEVVLSSKSLQTACRELVRLAKKNGGEDNITLILASYGSKETINDQELKTTADHYSHTLTLYHL